MGRKFSDLMSAMPKARQARIKAKVKLPPMYWRYQAVYIKPPKGERYYTICEVHLSKKDDSLVLWTDLDGSSGSNPIGDSVENLTNVLVQMLFDIRWHKAVDYADLKVGLKFERT